MTTPAVRELLEGREKVTNTGIFIWSDDRIAAKPGYATTSMSSATMICGAWSEIAFGLWGAGFEFQVNPFDRTGFKVGTIQARVLVSCDVAVKHAPAFTVSTSIT